MANVRYWHLADKVGFWPRLSANDPSQHRASCMMYVAFLTHPWGKTPRVYDRVIRFVNSAR
jgi:hypothetical protein